MEPDGLLKKIPEWKFICKKFAKRGLQKDVIKTPTKWNQILYKKYMSKNLCSEKGFKMMLLKTAEIKPDGLYEKKSE